MNRFGRDRFRQTSRTATSGRPLTQTASASDDVRWVKVERVRAAIAAGLYDTPEKLELALDAMIERHAG